MTAVQTQWLTLAFVLVVTVVVIAFDILAFQAWGANATISRVLRRVFEQYPILYPIFWLWVGILVGHIGLPACPR